MNMLLDSTSVTGLQLALRNPIQTSQEDLNGYFLYFHSDRSTCLLQFSHYTRHFPFDLYADNFT